MLLTTLHVQYQGPKCLAGVLEELRNQLHFLLAGTAWKEASQGEQRIRDARFPTQACCRPEQGQIEVPTLSPPSIGHHFQASLTSCRLSSHQGPSAQKRLLCRHERRDAAPCTKIRAHTIQSSLARSLTTCVLHVLRADQCHDWTSP